MTRLALVARVLVLAIVSLAVPTSAQTTQALRPTEVLRDALTGFRATGVRTAVGVTVRCEQGCEGAPPPIWKCETGRTCRWEISDVGERPEASDATLPARLRLTFDVRTDGVSLKCERGCMWRTQWAPCASNVSCNFAINEFGVRTAMSEQAQAARIAESVRALATRLATDKKSDFSGHWVPVEPNDVPTDVARELTVRQYVQNPKGIWPGDPVTRVLLVTRRVGNDVLTTRYEMGGGIAGGVAGGIAANGVQDPRHSRYGRSRRWDGDTFVIEDYSGSGTSENWSFTEHRETWALDANGRLVITTADRSSAGEPRTITLVYHRR